MTVHVRNNLPGIRLVPAPIETFGRQAELNDEIPGKVFRFDIASLFPPQTEQSRFITAHNDPGVRAAYKGAAARSLSSEFSKTLRHGNLANSQLIRCCDIDTCDNSTRRCL
jgi:hypothetical protein